MSQRTIVEFNHDYAYEIQKHENEFMTLLMILLSRGANCHPDNTRDSRLLSRLKAFGVTVTPTHHHSDQAEIVLSTDAGREYSRTKL